MSTLIERPRAAMIDTRRVMRVERIASVDDFRAMRGEWNALLGQSRANCVFLTWEWLFTWWKHFHAGRELAILAVREGAELVALAPFCLRRARVAGFELASLQFLGNSVVGSDYLDVIVRDDRRPAALRALGTHVASSGIRLELAQVARAGADTLALAADLAQRGWRMVAMPTQVCPYIALEGHSWESYLATLGRAHRANVRRRLRQMRGKFDVTFALATSSEERREALRTLVRLHLDRWRGRGISEAFGTPQLVAFHDDVTEIIRERGWLRLYVLALDQVPVAALYGFRYGRVFSFYQSGFDPAFAKWSVGLITMGLAIERAIADGAAEYDMLHGDESYKFLWARERRELSRLEIYPANARELTMAGARAVARAAKRAIRDITQRPARAGAHTAEPAEPTA